MPSPTIPIDLVLTGKLISLRPPTPADDQAMFTFFNDEKTMVHLLNIAPVGGFTLESMGERRKMYLEKWGKSEGFFMNMVEQSSGTVVGMCGLRSVDFVNRNGEVGIIIYHPYWSKGYATEAIYLVLQYGFEVLKLHRINAITSGGNAAMRGFFDYFGLKEEVVKKDASMIQGKFADSIEYALLESAWPSSKAKMEQKLTKKI